MSKYLKIAVWLSTLSLSTLAMATTAPYSLTNMPTPSELTAGVTPGQGDDNIQPDGMQNMVHIFRTGEGWSNGTQAEKQITGGCDWDLGTGCSFNDARDCEIASGIDTCNFEVMVNATYLTVDPTTGKQSCDSDSTNEAQSTVCSGLNITGGSGGWTYCQPASGGSWVMDPNEWDSSCPAQDNLLDCPSEYLGPGQIVMGGGNCYEFQWPTGNGIQNLNDGPAPWCTGNHDDCSYDMTASGGCTTTYSSNCGKNVKQVTIQWGDGSNSTATYDYAPSQNQYDPTDVPMYIANHSYSSLPNGAAGTYNIEVTENVNGNWVNETTYTTQPQVVWNLNYGYYGNGSCTYGWSGTNQMTVSTSAAQDNSGYSEAIDFNPSSGFSGATNITGSTQVCSTGSGNSGIGGSGFSLYPISLSGGSSQQVAYGNDITLDASNATWSGGPITVGNAWGWFEFYVANSSTVDITYNGAQVGTIAASNQDIAHVTPVLQGGQNYTQTVKVYVYHNTPPPVEGGAENASQTPSTLAEEPNP